MYTYSNKDEDDIVRSSTSESAAAYIASEKFLRDWGGGRLMPDVTSIREFVYRIYPTFFLQGLCYNNKFYIMNRYSVEVRSSLIDHCPSTFTRMTVSMLVRCMALNNNWILTDADIASIVLTCAADFSEKYTDFFPYTVRIFTSSDLKRVAYNSVFELAPIAFSVYEAEEPQAEVDTVVRSKLDEIQPLVVPGEIAVVDDTGLAMYVLGGNPGSNIKNFFKSMPPQEFNKIVRALGDNRGHVQIAVGAIFAIDDKFEKIVVEGNFPVQWKSHLDEKSATFDPYILYSNEDGEYMRDGDTPQVIMIQWLWHKFKRRLCIHWLDQQILSK